MKKNLILIASILLMAGTVSCSSDDGDDSNKSDDTSVKTTSVTIQVNLENPGTRTLASGDKLYVFNSATGSNGTVNVLSYDESEKVFYGNLTYISTDDKLSGFIKPASATSATVDTATRTISIDYTGQTGTMASAMQRDLYYGNAAATVGSLTADNAQAWTFYNYTAYLKISKPDTISATSYSLYSPQNETATKSSNISSSLSVIPQVSFTMNASAPSGDDGRITVNAATEGNDTYMAFYSQDLLDPKIEAKVTLSSGVHLIESYSVSGSSSTESSTYGGTIVDFDGGTVFSTSVSGEVKTGDFLCNAQWGVAAIIYDTKDVNVGGYTKARAIAVSDASSSSTTTWTSMSVIPSSLSSYITTDAANDLGGYELDAYVNYNPSYLAIYSAANYSSTMNGCSQWYLPSAGEWKKMWDNIGGLTELNKLLEQAGCETMPAVKHWTSSLKSLTEPYVVMDNGSSLTIVPQPIGSKNYVRASIAF